jgi:hypothetical protein
MLSKTKLTTLGGALLAAFASVLVSPASAAADDLRFVARPVKVVVNQSYENISWTLKGSDIGWVESVDAELEHVATRESAAFDYAYASDGLGGTFKFYDWERPGRYIVRGEAFDWDYNKMSVAPTYITAKYAARSTLSAKRSGRYVTLRSVTKKYTGSYPLWAPHRGVEMRFQRYANGAWRTLATRTVPRNGVTQVTVKKAVTARYRTVAVETKRVWSDRSPVVRR